MEKELFDWDGWDWDGEEGDHENMTFYNPVLKVVIGDYAVGSKFDYASIIAGPEKGVGVLELGFYKPDRVSRHSLHYRVGDELKSQ